MEESLVLQTTM